MPQEARFTRQFEARPRAGVLWEVTAELEIRERPTLSVDALAIAVAEDIPGLLAAIEGLESLVERQLPGPLSWN